MPPSHGMLNAIDEYQLGFSPKASGVGITHFTLTRINEKELP